MLYEVMRHIRNFFPVAYYDGIFAVDNGVLALPPTFKGSYVLIEKSAFNNGVFAIDADDLTDETFRGTITALAPPKSFLTLVSDIEDWQEKNGAGGIYQSESLSGVYSYTRATNAKGGAVTWIDAFAERLNTYRRL